MCFKVEKCQNSNYGLSLAPIEDDICHFHVQCTWHTKPHLIQPSVCIAHDKDICHLHIGGWSLILQTCLEPNLVHNCYSDIFPPWNASHATYGLWYRLLMLLENLLFFFSYRKHYISFNRRLISIHSRT